MSQKTVQLGMVAVGAAGAVAQGCSSTWSSLAVTVLLPAERGGDGGKSGKGGKRGKRGEKGSTRQQDDGAVGQGRGRWGQRGQLHTAARAFAWSSLAVTVWLPADGYEIVGSVGRRKPGRLALIDGILMPLEKFALEKCQIEYYG